MHAQEDGMAMNITFNHFSLPVHLPVVKMLPPHLSWSASRCISNPAGVFLSDAYYMRFLLAMFFVGLSTSLKRLWLATFLGRRSYEHFSSELDTLLAKMLLISQVAHLAREIDQHIFTGDVGDRLSYPMKAIAFQSADATDSEDGNNTPSLDGVESPNGQRLAMRNGFGKTLLDAGISSRIGSTRTTRRSSSGMISSTRNELMHLLEDWEEPEYKSNSKPKASITDILQFRQAIATLDDTYPFTPAFGLAQTRATCVESSERLYKTLQNRTPNDVLLPFETLSEICYDCNRQLMRDKAKALIKLFRPERSGFLTKLDFVSSIDDVYKDLRLFRASLANSSSIDDVFAMFINLFFYIVQVLIVLVILGYRQWGPIGSAFAFFFSFAFMFGPASSKLFEGILLIFVRRPYDIGDKISLSEPNKDTNTAGSSMWFVENVTVFTTTVRYASTNEVATYSNGSLARLRIANAK